MRGARSLPPDVSTGQNPASSPLFSVLRTKLVVNLSDQVGRVLICGEDWEFRKLTEDDDGLHEGSGYAATDGEEFGGGGEDFDEGRLGEVGEVDLHTVTEASG